MYLAGEGILESFGVALKRHLFVETPHDPRQFPRTAAINPFIPTRLAATRSLSDASHLIGVGTWRYGSAFWRTEPPLLLMRREPHFFSATPTGFHTLGFGRGWWLHYWPCPLCLAAFHHLGTGLKLVWILLTKVYLTATNAAKTVVPLRVG